MTFSKMLLFICYEQCSAGTPSADAPSAATVTQVRQSLDNDEKIFEIKYLDLQRKRNIPLLSI